MRLYKGYIHWDNTYRVYLLPNNVIVDVEYSKCSYCGDVGSAWINKYVYAGDYYTPLTKEMNQ